MAKCGLNWQLARKPLLDGWVLGLQWIDWNWLEGGKRGPNQGAKKCSKKVK
jgi:hypothetical protein